MLQDPYQKFSVDGHIEAKRKEIEAFQKVGRVSPKPTTGFVASLASTATQPLVILTKSFLSAAAERIKFWEPPSP